MNNNNNKDNTGGKRRKPQKRATAAALATQQQPQHGGDDEFRVVVHPSSSASFSSAARNHPAASAEPLLSSGSNCERSPLCFFGSGGDGVMGNEEDRENNDDKHRRLHNHPHHQQQHHPYPHHPNIGGGISSNFATASPAQHASAFSAAVDEVPLIDADDDDEAQQQQQHRQLYMTPADIVVDDDDEVVDPEASVDVEYLKDIAISELLVPLQEETGFEDPLGSNFNNFDNFDLVSFVGNDSESILPIDNPAQALFGAHHHHSAAIGGGLYHHHHQQKQQQQFNQAAAGLMIQYTAVHGNRGLPSVTATALVNGRGSLPDSPPITEVISSGNLSSESPSSGCGCPTDQSSPFTPPDHYANPHHRYTNSTGSAGSGNGAMRLTPQQQMQQLIIQQQQQKHLSLGRQLSTEQQLSSPEQQQPLLLHAPHHHPHHCSSQQPTPNGGGQHPQQFISPYPPSQSTPGSQVSPPSLLEHQQQHVGGRRYTLSGGGGANPTQMDIDQPPAVVQQQLYMNNNQQHQQQLPQPQSNGIVQIGNKRRRASLSNSSIGGPQQQPHQQQLGHLPQTEFQQQQQQVLMPLGHHLMPHQQQLLLDCSAGIVKREVPSGGGGAVCSGVSHGSGSSLDSAAAMLNDNDCSPVDTDSSYYTSQHHQPQIQRFFNASHEKENFEGGGLLASRTPVPGPHSHNSFDEYGCCYGDDACSGSGSGQRTIKFSAYLSEQWTALYDAEQRELPPMVLSVVADKGFNFSQQDSCFVNQKKNHFQITVNLAINPAAAQTPTMGPGPTCLALTQAEIGTSNAFTPHYVAFVDAESGVLELLPVLDFTLMFCGAKSETPTSEIQIKQSQTDRRPVNYEPVRFTLDGALGAVKQTVPRLHFSETTMNNHRKNGKPNPEQKYFLLVVKLMANAIVGTIRPDGSCQTRAILVQAFQSDRVIVRASNPGQFEQPETDVAWQKTPQGALAFTGQVCIGTTQPERDAQLTVMGDIVTSGNITRPSDRRVKENINEHDTREALDRLAQMRIVEYAYKPEIAERWGLSEDSRHRVGVIAQELAVVLPDAVRDNGEYLSVDDTRVFYETVAAAQELCRLTGNLECKINQVEQISQKLARITQWRKENAALRGSTWSGISDFSAWMLGRNATSGALDDGMTIKDGIDPIVEMEEDAAGGGRDPAAETRSCLTYLSRRTSLTSLPPGSGGAPCCGADDEPGGERRAKRSGGGLFKRAGGEGNRNRRGGDKPRPACCRHQQQCYGGGGCNSRAGPDLLCNSRLTQGTIVTLVIVMAFCLVAMCTLYVLDWYNRTYVYGVGFHHPHFNTGDFAHLWPGGQHPSVFSNGSDSPGKIITRDWQPPEQPASLTLNVRCGASSVGALLLEQVASMAVPFAASIPHCPQYCCGARSHYEAFAATRGAATDDDIVHPLQAIGGPGNDTDPGSPAAASLHFSPPSAFVVQNSQQQQQQQLPPDHPNVGLDEGVVGANQSPLPSEVLVALIKQMADAAAAEEVRPRPPPSLGVHIRIPALDATIDERYCVDRSCDSRNGLYNLYVPISPYMPPIASLELEITAKDSLRFVDGCGPLTGFQHRHCAVALTANAADTKEKRRKQGAEGGVAGGETSAAEAPTMYKVTNDVWELSAGLFYQSAYTFRVGHSASVCQAALEQRGRTYDQYNVFMYRACPPPLPAPVVAETNTNESNGTVSMIATASQHR